MVDCFLLELFILGFQCLVCKNGYQWTVNGILEGFEAFQRSPGPAPLQATNPNDQ